MIYQYASIKYAFLDFGGSSIPTFANKNMDSFDITSETGDYSIQIAGMSYPQKSLSVQITKREYLMNYVAQWEVYLIIITQWRSTIMNLV